MIRWKLFLACLVAVGISFAAGTAHADTITYTITGTAAVPGLPTDTFTATFVGNTASAVKVGTLTEVAVTSSFTFDGTSGAFVSNSTTGPLEFVFNSANDNVGFDYSGASAMFAIGTSYNDISAIGPLGISATTASGTFVTSLGNLALTPGEITGKTFTATVMPAPEPSSLLLLGMGMAVALFAFSRKTRSFELS